MMNDDTLRNIEYLREKADVSYEEASTLLERFDGNVMRVLVELERQGRVYPQGQTQQDPQPQRTPPRPEQPRGQAKEKATSFIEKAFEHHIVVEKVKGDKRETVANLTAPYVAGAAIIAPHLAAASIALMFVSGYRVRLKREKNGTQMPEDVETFVDKTVSNIKQTASSFTETVRGEKPPQDNDPRGRDNRHDDDDEGGEVTVD